tara:strand:- start:1060 stop:1485 length:426 start_codon:yes stop_codon:yes gene_type:complete
MKKCSIILTTAIITGLYDILLRYITENNLLKWDFIIALQPYFKEKTLLEGFLIAAFVGLVSQWIILSLYRFPKNWQQVIIFMIITIIISGSIGILMDKSKLFPDLSATYYKKLGRTRSMITDAWSGVIVQVTVIFLIFLYN